jgi:hypothetical protein
MGAAAKIDPVIGSRTLRHTSASRLANPSICAKPLSRSPSRAPYTNISETHFAWRGEKSDDGKGWGAFMVVEDNRSKE